MTRVYYSDTADFYCNNAFCYTKDSQIWILSYIVIGIVSFAVFASFHYRRSASVQNPQHNNSQQILQPNPQQILQLRIIYQFIQQSNHVPIGASQEIIDNNTVVFTLERTNQQDNPICTICQIEYETGEQVRQLGCNHLYHSACAVSWLLENRTCPVCRNDIEQSGE